MDDASLYDLETYIGNTLVDSQTVAQMADLKDNKFISWKTDAEIGGNCRNEFNRRNEDGFCHRRFIRLALDA